MSAVAITDAGENCFAFDKAVEGIKLVYSLFKLGMNQLIN
jgi:hypothetical protein